MKNVDLNFVYNAIKTCLKLYHLTLFVTCYRAKISITAYVFANGCRAPPWRQVHGDIAYIEVRTNEGEIFPITATTSGYYVNRGMKKDGEVDYNRESDVFSTLILLLKAKSAHFAHVINSKVTKRLLSQLCSNTPVTVVMFGIFHSIWFWLKFASLWKLLVL